MNKDDLPQTGPHPVLLWDLDNMPGRHWQLASLARVLSLTVPDGAPRFAAARRPTWRRTQATLRQFDFEALSGGRSASGADRRLCDQSAALRRQGYREFIVVSNDKYFSRLAALGEVHVLTLDPANLSTRLARAAASVTTLSFNGTGWTQDPCRPLQPRLTGNHHQLNAAVTSGSLLDVKPSFSA